MPFSINRVAALATMCISFSLCASVHAQLVEITFSGEVTATSHLGLAPASLQGTTVGDLFRISLIVEKADLESGGVGGLYAGAESVTVTIGAASSTTTISPTLSVNFWKTFLGGTHDELSVDWDSSSNGGMQFTDGSVFEQLTARAALPLGFLNPEFAIPTDLDEMGNLLYPGTGSTNLNWFMQTGGGMTASIGGLMNHVSAAIVPAPGGIALFLLSCGAAVIRRR